MDEFTIKSIVDAISKKINSIFGDNYNIETNNVEQGFEAPCFFIKQINGTRQHMLGNRYKSNLNFQIIGFAIDDKEEDLQSMAENLYELEFITLLNGDVIRAFNMNHRVEDAVLQFFFDINNFINKQGVIEENMDEISVNGGIKNGE